jgi:hypothetical protein
MYNTLVGPLQPLKMKKALRSFETSSNSNPVTRHLILEDQGPQVVKMLGCIINCLYKPKVVFAICGDNCY